MNLLLTLAAFVVALSVLIVIHEFGHYWVARRCGVKVLCFSVGFGRALWSRTFGPDQTELRIALIPLGGYVKMLDEREGDVVPSELQRAFNRKSVWQRFAIVAAGPAANFIAAIFLYWALFLHGMPGVLPILGQPVENSVAARSGFAAGDTVVSVDGKNVPSWQDFRWIMLQHAVDRSPVVIEVRNEQQAIYKREIQFDSLASKDLEGDLLGALGFMRFRLPLQPVIGEVVAGGAAIWWLPSMARRLIPGTLLSVGFVRPRIVNFVFACGVTKLICRLLWLFRNGWREGGPSSVVSVLGPGLMSRPCCGSGSRSLTDRSKVLRRRLQKPGKPQCSACACWGR